MMTSFIYMPAQQKALDHVIAALGLVGTAASTDDQLEQGPLSLSDIRTLEMLKNIPFLIPFTARYEAMQRVFEQTEGPHPSFDMWSGGGSVVRIRRTHLYEVGRAII